MSNYSSENAKKYRNTTRVVETTGHSEKKKEDINPGKPKESTIVVDAPLSTSQG